MIIIGNYVINKDEIIMIYNDKNMDLQDGIRIVFKDKNIKDIFLIDYDIDDIQLRGDLYEQNISRLFAERSTI